MNLVLHGKQPKLGLFSGIHGDEWRVISSVKKAVDHHFSSLSPFLYIPECSPSAVELKTRLNSDGLDLNRCFMEVPKCQEATDVMKIISPHVFDLCVDFHEDNEHGGVYLYDNIDIEGSDKLNNFRAKCQLIGSLFSGIDDQSDEDLGRQVKNGYRVSLPPEKD